MTMADLLHWASGLDWQEDYEYAPLKSSVVAMLYTRGHQDIAAFTADHDEYAQPGQAFRYSSGDTNLLSAALKTIVGPTRYPDYPWTALFEPLGIRHAVWETDATRHLRRLVLCLPHRPGPGTSRPADGPRRSLGRSAIAAQGLGRLQPRTFRPLSSQSGRSGARRSLVAQSLRWRAPQQPWPDAPADTFAALGHWGQAMYVIPGEHLVIVRYGDDRDGSYRHNELLKLALKAFVAKVQP